MANSVFREHWETRRQMLPSDVYQTVIEVVRFHDKTFDISAGKVREGWRTVLCDNVRIGVGIRGVGLVIKATKIAFAIL
jgi:hypothetical protein